MSTKHTPGPWAFIDQDRTHVEFVQADAEGEDSIAYHGADWPMNEADKRLIAAAPDLLAALERIVACDLSTMRSDYNGALALLLAISDAHDLLCKVQS